MRQSFLSQLISRDCLLCGASSRAALCAPCAGSLPGNGTAVCPQCGAQSLQGLHCGDCLAHTPAFDAAVVAYRYGFPLDQLVAQFKYGARLALGPILAEPLAAAARIAAIGQVDALVPIPLSRQRLAERGFNQAGILADHVSKALKIRVEHQLLKRVKHTVPQVELDWASRQTNLRRAFASGAAAKGLTIALVDDVMTTGATLHEAARALKKAGAERVEVWVVARADRSHAVMPAAGPADAHV